MENVFNVPKRQWKKWSPLSRAVFNDVYELMSDNPSLFMHPDNVPYAEWYVTAWNAAWIAAEAVKDNKAFENVRSK